MNKGFMKETRLNLSVLHINKENNLWLNGNTVA